jgi:hypothetical protein
MKKAFIGLLILILSAWAQYVFSAEPIQLARMNPYVAGGAGAASKSCAVDSVLWIDKFYTDDFYSVAREATNTFAGQGDFDPGENKVICQVSHNVRNAVGTDDYQVEIYIMNGTALGTLNAGCTSNTKTISGAGTVNFDGLNCSVSSGTTYGIVITRHDHGNGEDNNLVNGIHVATGANMSVSGNFMVWNADLSRKSSRTADLSIKIYGYTP